VYSAQNPTLIRHSDVIGDTTSTTITHSVNFEIGGGGTIGGDASPWEGFAKLSYNFSGEYKIDHSYLIEIRMLSEYTVPGGNIPGYAWEVYTKTVTPRHKHLCRAYGSDGYQGGISQVVDDLSYSEMKVDKVATLGS
jgi:hypothetical protein